MAGGDRKLDIESMQTVMPTKSTDRQSRLVSLVDYHGTAIFQSRLHVVLYYEKSSEADCGWLVAGWIKESLGTALLEKPMLGGRPRKIENAAGGGREMEIVSNDCGVRLLEAQINIQLSSFLDIKDKEEAAEAQLVFWEDIDQQNPQFSPLCYVQVTNFECGGYSIGLSCSTLVTDPLVMTSFLKRWFDIHRRIISTSDNPNKPLFYSPNRRKTIKDLVVLNVNCSSPSKNSGQTAIFNVASSQYLNSDYDTKRALAAVCIEEAERKFGRKMSTDCSLIIKQIPSEDIKVETFSRKGLLVTTRPVLSFVKGLSCTSLDDLGIEELSLQEGNKPARVSYWINTISNEGHVMIIPSPDHEGTSGTTIIITIPNDDEKRM